MATRTITFLPKVFQTDNNNKFLNATLDQLVTDPNFVRVNGYVGRTNTLAFAPGDNYLLEPTQRRQKYQFEPTVVVKTANGTESTVNYNDLLDSIAFNGGLINNHDRLFGNKYYSYDGLIDYDKFINFSQYYWIPNGPDSVTVSTQNAVTVDEYDVTRNSFESSYEFSSLRESNPTIVLVRGGTYRFNVDQPGNGFFIQAEPGTSGVYSYQKNTSAREILGISNNGVEQGTLTFNVPLKDAQDWILQLDLEREVNYATQLKYSDVHNHSLEQVLAKFGGLDGVADIENKFFVFVEASSSDSDWIAPGIYEDYLFPYDAAGYDAGNIVPQEHRRGVFSLQVDRNYARPIVKLNFVSPVAVGKKVRVLGGNTYAYREFWRDPETDALELLPPVTANIDLLWYQDATDADRYGPIKIVDLVSSTPIDVEKDIIGQRNYTSLNGIRFTNGLKIRFDTTATPTSYQTQEYYIEGVGDAIRLVPVVDLVGSEPYIKPVIQRWDVAKWDTTPWEVSSNAAAQPDYFTINRASRDRNAWSRNNRWFHYDVLQATADYNNVELDLDQGARASRPIIEFDYDLQLFDMGREAKAPVDLIDTSVTDVFSFVQGSTSWQVDGFELETGDRVIFTADEDPEVRNRVYKVYIVDPTGDGSTVKHLILEADGLFQKYECVFVKKGLANKGRTFWYDGIEWNFAQQKTALNQPPLFDVFDDSGTSLSDQSKYPGSTFSGTKLFSYKLGTGTPDNVLKIPFSYKTLQNIGDVVFENNFDGDHFSYTLDGLTITKKIGIGRVHINNSLTDFSERTVWIQATEDTKQLQLWQYIVDQSSSTEFFVATAGESDSYINNFKLFLNNNFVTRTQFEFVEKVDGLYVNVLLPLTPGDRIDIYVYDNRVLGGDSFYVVPKNLENNANNQLSTEFTLGQLRNHATQLFNRSRQTQGVFPGVGNVRDLPRIKDVGGSILQHSGSLIPAALFLGNPNLNLIDAIQYAAREYSRFKNRLLDQVYNLNISSYDDIPALLDSVLQELNSVKTKDFPWYASDMLAYGKDSIENITEISVDDNDQREYNLFDTFNLTRPNFRSVLVYLNNVQLVQGLDYTFDAELPILILTPQLIVEQDDVLKIVEYNTTLGCWIPETPSKMGLWPAREPRIYLDDTFVDPIQCIEGHDGSITPAFGDFRDEFLLEFEKRIYNNIKAKWNLDKLSIYDVKPGAFRSTQYSLEEYNSVMARYFSSWAGANKLNYSETIGYQSNNPFTWNYKRMQDKVFGELLPGSWRAIFEHFYDTQRPHTHPWEMLGFDLKPDWWERRYGIAPYTSGNLVLWGDLEEGRIFSGPREGVDSRFTRPGLLSVIPTDDYGNLRSPVEIFVKSFDSRQTRISYEFGEIGPVEAAWRRSSEFAFAAQTVLALTSPAKYFGLFVDNSNYLLDKGINEFTFGRENRRIQTSDYIYNGDQTSGETRSQASYINWVIDRLNSLGINGVDKVKTLVNSSEVKLTYSVAGYSDLNFIKVLVEQASPNATNKSIIVPDDNQALEIKKSNPQSKITYSAVIIERTGTGYRVQGYDLQNPFFNIIPSVANSQSQIITVLGTSATLYEKYEAVKVSVPYGTEFVNRQQVADFLISYQRYLTSQGIKFDEYDSDLAETRSFVLAAREFLLWSQQGWGQDMVIVLNPLANQITLQSNGYSVDEINGVNVSSGKVLDPNFNYLKTSQFNILRVGNTFKITAINSSIALVEMNLVQYEHVLVLDNRTVFNDVIFEPESGNRQQRVKLTGYKTIDWDGTLSAPGFIYNDNKVAGWSPGLDYRKGTLVEFKNQYYTAIENLPAQPEFAFEKWQLVDRTKIKTGLLPNFATLAQRSENFYDLMNVNLESNVEAFAKGLLGFRSRSYLADLGIDDVSQVKFYQGYIKEKGTATALNSLLGANFDYFTSDIKFYENWAVRAGEYGAIDINQEVEIVLPEKEFSNNPAFAEFLNDGDDEVIGRYGYKSAASWTPDTPYQQNQYVFHEGVLYRVTEEEYESGEIFDSHGLVAIDESKSLRLVPKNYQKSLFLTTKDKINIESQLRTAGYLKLTDVGGTIFDIENISLDSRLDFIRGIGSGFTLWVAKKLNKDWALYRASQTDLVVTEISNALEGNVSVTTDRNHNLQVNDFVVIKNFDDRFDNLYKVQAIDSLKTFIVKINQDEVSLDGFVSVTGAGVIYTLDNIRFDRINDWSQYTPKEGWRQNDVVAIDRWGPDYVDWAVWKKEDIWNQVAQINRNNEIDQEFGSAVAFLDQGAYMLVGASSELAGAVHIFKRQPNKEYTFLTTITESTADLAGFGSVISASNASIFAVGSAESASQQGYVHVYKRTGDSFEIVGSVLSGTSPADLFGKSLALSQDGKWLYVGAPGANSVFAYSFDGTDLTYSGSAITAGDTGLGDKFGWALSTTTDGAQVIIGAPDHDAIAQNNGAVYIFDRSVEKFVATTETAVFAVLRSPNALIKRALIDGVEQEGVTYTGTGNRTVTFEDTVPLGSIVSIETNNFQLMKKLTAHAAQESQRFGSSVVICPFNCTVYVGAPERDSDENALNIGAVYRFSNLGRLYGVAEGSVENPSVTPGHGIRINDFDVVFSGSSLSSVVSNINAAAIPGVFAEAVNNKLKITADLVLLADKLRVSPGIGAALEDLGLDIFELTQTITNPFPEQQDNFGEVLSISSDALKVFVGSTQDSTIQLTTFDKNTVETTFDQVSVLFRDDIGVSGSVLVYEYVSERVDTNERPGFFILDTFLRAANTSSFDRFGASIAHYNGTIAIGAVGHDTNGNNYGSVMLFRSSRFSAWYVSGAAEEKVDVRAINRMYIYNTRNNIKLADLDYIDPVKGKVHGEALNNIDYITAADPATYGNNQDTKAFVWGDSQLGTVWWNADAVRYLDYEQGDFEYRRNNWGRVFPGSAIEVYEWTKASVLPSQYVSAGLDGLPAFDDSKVVENTFIDKVTGTISVDYYYWVKNKTTVDYPSGRTKTLKTVADIIENPKGQGLSYAVIAADNLVGLYNIGQFLESNNATLHIDYDLKLNSNVIHSEYDLLQENRPGNKPIAKIINKLIDSLSGQNAQGDPVPDPALRDRIRYGIQFRPRQTMFRDRNLALREAIEFVNFVLSKYKLFEFFEADRLNRQEPQPLAYTESWNQKVSSVTELDYLLTELLPQDYRVLVESDSNFNGKWSIYQYSSEEQWQLVRVQTYNLTQYWEYSEYVAEGYDASKLPTFTVDTVNDLRKHTFNAGDIVRINNNGTGRHEIVRFIDVDGVLDTEIVLLQRGTVEISSALYETTTSLREVRELFDVVFNELFIDELEIHANQLFFVLVRYIFREQKYVDWIFKTSLIDVIHNFRKLDQKSVYQKDNQDFLLGYINETKPYHTKIREYLLDYTGDDPWLGDPTDFDLPAYYDSELRVFRSPSGELEKDSDLIATDPQYRMWNENYTFGVDSITVAERGSGYSAPPSITVTPPDVGDDVATAYAIVSGGRIIRIVVTNSGSGYITTPMVTVTAQGTFNTAAKLTARLDNTKLRRIKTNIKFDRYNYTTAVITWQPNTEYLEGQYLSYEGIVYNVTSQFISGSRFNTDNLSKISNQDLSQLQDGDFGSANDRIAAYYKPQFGMPGNSLTQTQSGIEFPGHTVTGRYFTGLPSGYPLVNAEQDDTVITSQFTDVALGIRPADIIVDGVGFIDENHSHSPEELVPGQVFDALDIKVFTSPRSDTTPFRTEGAGPATKAFVYSGNGISTQFSFDVAGTYDDVVFVYTKSNGYQYAGVDYTIDYIGRTINFTTPLQLNDKVYITVQNHGGNSLLYDTIFVADGVINSYSLPTSATSIAEILVFVNGERRFAGQGELDYSATIEQDVLSISFNTLLNNVDYIHIYAYRLPGLAREIHTTFRTTSGLDISVNWQAVADAILRAAVSDPVADSFDTFVRSFDAARRYGDLDNSGVITSTDSLAADRYGQNLTVTPQQAENAAKIENEIKTNSTAYPSSYYSIISSAPVYPDDYLFELDRAAGVKRPWAASMLVYASNRRLRPPNNAYYIIDSPSDTFSPSYPADVNGATVLDGDIEVFVNGVLQLIDVDYVLSEIDGSSLRTVTFLEPVPEGSEVVIACLSGAEYRVEGADRIRINPNVSLVAGEQIRIVTYANHDTARIKTTVGIGGAILSSSFAEGFDNPLGFDGSPFDDVIPVFLTKPIFALQEVYNNIDYIFVYKNGERLFPIVDYILSESGDQLEFTVDINSNDVLIVTEFTELSQQGLISYRMFKNLLDQTSWFRIGGEEITALSQQLLITDSDIHVFDASRCPEPSKSSNKPGVIFVNSERIEYWSRDLSENTLTEILRSTGGTGAPAVHSVGTAVVAASSAQEVPVEFDSTSIAKWAPNQTFASGSYVLYGNQLYQASATYTSGSEFGIADETNLEIRHQIRDRIWYRVVPGGQISEDGSTIEVLTDGKGLQDAGTVQARFLRQIPGAIVI
jgi:hypothetical protein